MIVSFAVRRACRALPVSCVLALAACATSVPPAPVATSAPAPRAVEPAARAPVEQVAPPAASLPSPAIPPAAPPPRTTATEGRARVSRLLPPGIADRSGWAADIHAAFAALDLAPTAEQFCAAIAVIEQESGFRADPAVPGLPKLAWREIEKQRERSGIPTVVLWGALALRSSNGRSYRARIDAVKTERELSEIFEDFIGMVPLGKTYFADRNPVRTGGPMQVSIAFAEAHAALRPYPYPAPGSIRHEVFKRRGGVYFGIAHLLDYPAAYDTPLYRFADFNAGRYASRNAAFQAAVARLTGVPLALDGDVLRYAGGSPVKTASATERALGALAARLKMTPAEIRRDLELGRSADFERSRLYFRLYVLADAAAGRPVPRAVLPRIDLKGPKITRKLTTEWFARRVEGRYRACLARGE